MSGCQCYGAGCASCGTGPYWGPRQDAPRLPPDLDAVMAANDARVLAEWDDEWRARQKDARPQVYYPPEYVCGECHWSGGSHPNGCPNKEPPPEEYEPETEGEPRPVPDVIDDDLPF